MGLDPVRYGIISTAAINEMIIQGARASETVSLIAVSSRDESRAHEYAHEWGIERSYGSYQAMLADPDIEAVYISLPNSLHVEWTLRALEAGKHVLVEKPITRRPAEVDRIWDLAEARGLQVTEAFSWRRMPQTARFKQLVEDGAIGTLQLVRSVFTFPMPDPKTNVRMFPDLEGGALMDVGVYPVSGSRLLAGEPVCVYGEQVLGGHGVDVRFSGLMQFAGDVRALFYCSFETPLCQELEAIGSEGIVRSLDPWHGGQGAIELLRGEERERELIKVEIGDGYRLELEDLARAVRGEGRPLLGREDAAGQARALAALYLSADEGRSVKLAELDREV